MGHIFDINQSLNINYILFAFDMKNWEEIKNKTLKQYIQERMEVFDLSSVEQETPDGEGAEPKD